MCLARITPNSEHRGHREAPRVRTERANSERPEKSIGLTRRVAGVASFFFEGAEFQSRGDQAWPIQKSVRLAIANRTHSIVSTGINRPPLTSDVGEAASAVVKTESNSAE